MNKPSTFELSQAQFSLKRRNASLTQSAHINFFFCPTKIVTWHDICPLWIDKTFAALLLVLLLLRAQMMWDVGFVNNRSSTLLSLEEAII